MTVSALTQATREGEAYPEQASATPLLQAILESPGQVHRTIDGLVIATMTGLADGIPEVSVPMSRLPDPILAHSLCPVSLDCIGRRCAVMFERGDPQRPIILGFIRQPQAVAVQVDGERQVIEAEKEIVLRCGKASITLTRAGKVIIQGEYLLSRSYGANRIQGGSIEIN